MKYKLGLRIAATHIFLVAIFPHLECTSYDIPRPESCKTLTAEPKLLRTGQNFHGQPGDELESADLSGDSTSGDQKQAENYNLRNVQGDEFKDDESEDEIPLTSPVSLLNLLLMCF